MSTHKSDVLRNLFALELNAKLTVKYRNIPSAEKIATDIRVSSDYKLDPHGQTVRKWLKGETFPDLVNLAHLVDWLDLNMTHVFETFKYLNRDNDGYRRMSDYCNVSVEDITNLEMILLKIKISNPGLP